MAVFGLYAFNSCVQRPQEQVKSRRGTRSVGKVEQRRANVPRHPTITTDTDYLRESGNARFKRRRDRALPEHVMNVRVCASVNDPQAARCRSDSPRGYQCLRSRMTAVGSVPPWRELAMSVLVLFVGHGHSRRVNTVSASHGTRAGRVRHPSHAASCEL